MFDNGSLLRRRKRFKTNVGSKKSLDSPLSPDQFDAKSQSFSRDEYADQEASVKKRTISEAENEESRSQCYSDDHQEDTEARFAAVSQSDSAGPEPPNMLIDSKLSLIHI